MNVLGVFFCELSGTFFGGFFSGFLFIGFGYGGVALAGRFVRFSSFFPEFFFFLNGNPLLFFLIFSPGENDGRNKSGDDDEVSDNRPVARIRHGNGGSRGGGRDGFFTLVFLAGDRGKFGAGRR